MSLQKEKKIKKLKKKHVLPYIFGIIALNLYFVFMIFIVVEVFNTIILDNEMGAAYDNANWFAGIMEKDLKASPDAKLEDIILKYEFSKSVELCVYDEKHKLVYKNVDVEPDFDEMLYYEFSEGGYIEKSVDGNDFIVIDKNKIKIRPSATIKLITRLLEEGNNNDKGFSDWFRTKAFDVYVWLDIPVEAASGDGNYTIRIRNDIIIRNSHILYLVVICAFAVIITIVPTIMYIHGCISSLITQKRLSKLLYFDTITGANNWVYFKEKAGKYIKKRKDKHYAMISFRLDKYRSYCACYGTAEGEELLEKIAKIIAKNISKKEAYARHSNSEYGLLLVMESADALNSRMDNLKERLRVCAVGRNIDFNVGICEVEDRNASVDELYSCASMARTNAPEEDPHKITWFNEQMKSEQMWERKVEESMEAALENREFQVYLQPKYNADTHVLGGAEALIRWISPTEGFIGPGRFIPIFEKNGFITKIDDYMLTEVAKLQADWISKGRKVVPISVNISRAHFTQDNLAEHICKIVDGVGAPRDSIELELTESAFFDDKDVLLNTVHKLKEMGFVISMDDFGAGYSSLNSLKDLPLDVVKLDAEFFRGNENAEERGEIVVKEAIQLAKNLDMRIVAEGIETKEQVDFLANHGCDLIQGFYFAKPMPVADFETKAFEEKAEQIIEEKAEEKKDVDVDIT